MSDFAWFYNIRWSQKKKSFKQICLSGAFERILAQKVGNENKSIFKSSNARGVRMGGMMKLGIVRGTTKTQERYTRRHFYTNCIFLWFLGEKRQIQKIRQWVCNKVCNWVTKQICRRVFSNGLWRRVCHNIWKRICRIICKLVTRIG